MPIIEYYSPDSHKIYSFFARTLAQTEIIPLCPDDPSFRMEKMISTFSITGKSEKKETEAIDDPQFTSALNETEKLLAGLDSDNPDPRQLGAAIRKMAEASGEKIDGNFEEMVRRLEEGVDPAKVEQDFSEVINEDELKTDDQEQEDQYLKRKLGSWARKKTPQRDPKLYDYE